MVKLKKFDIKQKGDSLTNKLDSKINLLYRNKRSIIVLGFSLLIFPITPIFLSMINPKFTYNFFDSYSKNSIILLMLLGFLFLYSAIILFGYKIEKDILFKIYLSKIVITLAALLGVTSAFGKTIFIISYIWLLFLFINESIKMVNKLFLKVRKLKVGVQKTLVLTVIARILSL